MRERSARAVRLVLPLRPHPVPLALDGNGHLLFHHLLEVVERHLLLYAEVPNLLVVDKVEVLVRVRRHHEGVRDVLPLQRRAEALRGARVVALQRAIVQNDGQPRAVEEYGPN